MRRSPPEPGSFFNGMSPEPAPSRSSTKGIPPVRAAVVHRRAAGRDRLDKTERVPVPNDSPVDAIAPLFEIERARLLGLLRELDPEAWQRPSPCPGWSVHGLVTHLLGDDLGLLSRRRDEYMGTPPPEGQSEAEFIDWLDELQMEWVRAGRRISPRLLVELLEWTGPHLIEVLGAEDLTRRVAHVSWAGPDLSPVWLDQLRELSEYWIHRQQLLEALDRPVDLDPTLLHPILLGLRCALPYRLSQARLASEGAIEISVGEPIGARWTLVETDGEWEFSTSLPERIVARVSVTADETWRLLTNNLGIGSGLLDVTGDERLVAIILDTRAIIGHPK
ncbi:MAG: maleylpyruvate isomerase N-terminal domain-containing protein [Acidimicrobiales bacterium]